MKLTATIGLAITGGVIFAVRNEFRRYLRIKRIGQNPALVGVSVTTQGNELALRGSPIRRLINRAG